MKSVYFIAKSFYSSPLVDLYKELVLGNTSLEVMKKMKRTDLALEAKEAIEDEGEIYESIEDIWPDYPSKDDFFFNEEEY